MASQDQNIDHSRITNSSVQQVQAGRDAVSFLNSHDNQVIIENTFLRLFGISESSQVDWDWGKLLLEKKQLPEIRQRLTDTLGRDRIFMDVAIAEQPSWVNRSPLEADRRLQIDGEDCGILDPNKMLIETFGRDDIKGTLLILGAPGSGKTTALLSLAEQLVCGALAQPKTVIPVLFELSTWRDDNQSIHDWLIEQLYDLHGGNRKRKIYEQWLERQILLPLLDGLDELGLERQKKCTDKLNEFAKKYSQMVVCCRVKEFETVNIKLHNLRGAVCLQPLSDGQIEAYLHSIHRSELWSAMQTNPALQALLETTPEGDPGLLRVPLFVRLTADVYDPNNPILSRKDLLEKYIERQLSFDRRERDRRKGLKGRKWAYKTVEAEPKLQETISSLSWIARQLQANNTVELMIEQMQPSWIESPRLQGNYKLILGLNLGLILGLFGGMSGGLIGWKIGAGVVFEKPFLGLIGGLSGGLAGGLMVGNKMGLGFSSEIKPVETFQVQISAEAILKILREFTDGSAHGIVSAWFLGKISGWIVGMIYGLLMWSKGGVILGLFWGLFMGFFVFFIVMSFWFIVASLLGGLIQGMKQELKIRVLANQGIWNSLQNMWLMTILSFPLFAISAKLSNISLFFESFHPSSNIGSVSISSSAAIGLLMAVIFSLNAGGGLACMQHLSLRIVLWRSGTIPWNFARFLNYCVERRLLLRVGGRYRFLHRELLDHFAQSGS
ncbi:MAG: NACHT domain-containing protein [Microcystis sp. M090S1]|uniref:NACHT domain-containing protein n=1 Tax=Microcystis sp. M090S1 TaxID=2771135 RepID=UPI002588CE8E|nr:NACHT domain-containing protein [Microcystis sp. M090S1]MCA2812277.1 NACHT domain-containing protein [Microcystis sp. M090S1]